jgi:hypothetical protein
MKNQAKPKARPLYEAPSSMTLRFSDPTKRDKFIALAKREGYHGTIKREENRDVVKIVGFKNKTAYTKLTAAWASMTMEYAGGPDRRQRTLHFTRKEDFDKALDDFIMGDKK